jgi:outer membrane protein assembly factor BamB
MKEHSRCAKPILAGAFLPARIPWPKARPRIGWILLLLTTLSLSPRLRAVEWTQYSGPNLDGSSPETVRTNWGRLPPHVVWRKSIGPGWSSVAVSGGRVFTLEKRTVNGSPREVCLALDAATGDPIWSADLDDAVYTDLSGYDDRVDGPRSTPTVEGDRVYVFTAQLKLFCLRFDNGHEIWSRDFPAELGSSNISWENAASPLLVGDLIYVNGNASGKRLMAIRKLDGTPAWNVRDDGMTHATPIYGTIGGVAQVIFLTKTGLVAVNPLTGALLWRLPFTPSSTSTAASPAIVGDYVHASAAYASGMWVAKVVNNGGTFTATQSGRQQGNAYQVHWSTPVADNGFLYCVPSPSNGPYRLACLDIAAGTNRWSQQTVGSGNIGYGSIIKAANTLIVLTESGELVLVQADPTAYRETAKSKILDLYSWNHVALSDGIIYARNSSLASEIVAIDVAPAVMPLPALTLDAELLGVKVALTIRAVSGASLDAGQAARLELLANTDLTTPGTNWPALNVSFTVTNGVLAAEVPVIPGNARFLRVHEKAATP